MPKTPRNCVVCGQQFIARTNGARNIVCSDACAVSRYGMQQPQEPCIDCGKPTNIRAGMDTVCRFCQKQRQNTHQATCKNCGVTFRARVKWAKWCESCVINVRRQQQRARAHRKAEGDADDVPSAAASPAIGAAGEHLFDAAMALHGIVCCRSTTENQKAWDRVVTLDGVAVKVQVKTAKSYVREGCAKISHAKAIKNSGVLLGLVVLSDASVHICSSDAILGHADRATVDTSQGGVVSLWMNGAKWSAQHACEDSVCEPASSASWKVDEAVQHVEMETGACGIQEAESALQSLSISWDYDAIRACGSHNSAQGIDATVLGSIQLAGAVPFMP